MIDTHIWLVLVLTQHSFPVTIDSSTADLIADFFVPALSASVRYDRGVGYFSAGWLRLTAHGMIKFAENGGRARWVTSPILDEDDWLALKQGVAAKTDLALRTALERNIDELEKSLERDTLSALAWMIADGIVDFRLALPRNKLHGGEFHDKFGIFRDSDGNLVSFNGSYNESIQGTRNYESLRIFCSWNLSFTQLVEDDSKRFERVWNNLDPNVEVYTIPDAAKARILKLRTEERPYRVHDRELLPLAVLEPRVPPGLTMRDYQVQAIDAWFDAGCVGLLEMATGAGKTITSLAATAKLYEREGRLAIIIAAPYQHLVDQWAEVCKDFGLTPILAYQSKSSWLPKLKERITEYARGDRKLVSVITTHTTFIDDDFQSLVARLQGPALLIADEVHHLGAERSRKSLPDNVPFRLALSATPDRWMDEVGTHALRAYFGQTVFQFTLAEAIAKGVLVPYLYYPILVELTEDEIEEYRDLTHRIVVLMNSKDPDDEETLTMLLIKRAKVLNNASEKLPALQQLIGDLGQIDHALVYCSPEQIGDVQRVLGWDMGLLVKRFTAEESSSERQDILTRFDQGSYQALVAMKCLDEGVDVPSTRTAFIMASSGNPREFIQRRGRILRRSEGKHEAIIYDLVAVPSPSGSTSADFNTERSIMRRELARYMEFASSAKNKHKALDTISEIAKQYGIVV